MKTKRILAKNPQIRDIKSPPNVKKVTRENKFAQKFLSLRSIKFYFSMKHDKWNRRSNTKLSQNNEYKSTSLFKNV